MPQVPTYDNFKAMPNSMAGGSLQAPSVEPFAAKQAQETGAGMMHLGNALMTIEEQMAATAAKDADNQFAPKLNALLNDPNNGYLTQSGKNAVDRYKPTIDALGKLKSQELDSIQDPIARQHAEMIFNHRADEALNRINIHAAHQTRQWQIDTSQARMTMSMQDAADNYKDPINFNLSLGTVHEEIDHQAQMQGWSADQISLVKAEATDKTYRMKYKAWQQEDPVGALSDFQSNQSKLNPITRESISNELFSSAAPQLVNQLLDRGGPEEVYAQSPGGPNEPRGIRNNNPGNLVKSDNKWNGEINGDDPRFATFATPEAGIAAMCKNLLSYQNKYGLKTVSDIIARWAPASDKNNTQAYTSAVAKALGVKPDDELDLKNTETMADMCKAMIKHENGKVHYSDGQIAAGVDHAINKTELPKAPESVDASVIDSTEKWRNPEFKTGIDPLDKMPPDQRLKILEMAQSKQHQNLSDYRNLIAGKARDAAAEYMVNGTATNPPTQDQFLRAYGQVEGLRRYNDMQEAAKTGSALQMVKGVSNAQLNQMLKDSKPTGGDGFADREQNYMILQKAAAATQKARQDDPIDYALNNAGYNIKPITDFGQGFIDQMRQRGNAMPDIARDYGTPPAVLSKQEAEAFGGYMSNLQPEDQANVLAGLMQSVGADGVQSIGRQLKDKHNTLSIAALLSSFTEPDQHGLFGGVTPGRNAAILYLKGKDALAKKLVKVNEQDEVGTIAMINQAIAGVYQSPQESAAASEAAFGIWANDKASGGDGDIANAVKLATGGIFEHNGKPIAKPYSWDDSRFVDSLSSKATLQNIKAQGNQFSVSGHSVSAEELYKMLPAAQLQTWKESGKYMVRDGNGVVLRSDGRPFVLAVGEDK